MAPGRSSGGEGAALAALLRDDPGDANGDDAAIVRIPGALACVSTDTAVEGVHLHPTLTPHEMGYRAAACAISDLAAMAATPACCVCAVSVPAGRWHDAPAVVAGARQRAREQRCDLVGGDLVAAGAGGGWSVTVTVVGSGAGIGRHGLVRRNGMREGDELFVTGELGRSAAALRALDGDGAADAAPREWYVAPPDRLDAARALAPHATAIIDLSDGLAADAGHLCDASGCGARIDLDRLPVTAALAGEDDPMLVAAAAGDDYELLVAAPAGSEAQLCAALAVVDPDLQLTKIGVAADTSLTLFRHGQPVVGLRGFAHG